MSKFNPGPGSTRNGERPAGERPAAAAQPPRPPAIPEVEDLTAAEKAGDWVRENWPWLLGGVIVIALLIIYWRDLTGIWRDIVDTWRASNNVKR